MRQVLECLWVIVIILNKKLMRGKNLLDCHAALAMTRGLRTQEIKHICHCEGAGRPWQSSKYNQIINLDFAEK